MTCCSIPNFHTIRNLVHCSYLFLPKQSENHAVDSYGSGNSIIRSSQPKPRRVQNRLGRLIKAIHLLKKSKNNTLHLCTSLFIKFMGSNNINFVNTYNATNYHAQYKKRRGNLFRDIFGRFQNQALISTWQM